MKFIIGLSVFFLKFLSWASMFFIAEKIWILISKTIFSGFSWIAIVLPLSLLFVISNQTGELKILRWLFILLFGLGALYFLTVGVFAVGLLWLSIAMQLLWMNIKSRSKSILDTSNNSHRLDNLITIVLAFFTLWGGLNVSGYCFAKHHYLTDNEQTHIAVAYALNRGFKGLHDYQSVEDFLAYNPNCCFVSNDCLSGIEDGINRPIGNLSTCVYVLEDKGDIRPEDKATSAIGVSNCGKAWSFFD
ncbi:MAG: hypothetical protein HOP02_07170 [Methylococcaceae bacterium]|nr:hypothetical protein [Methylococcaceae bacterium]